MNDIERAEWLADKLVGEYGSEAARLLRKFASSARSESAPITELQVQAGAVILATTPLIDAPKLSHDSWMGLSRQILEAADAVRK